jgi:hypothetical protein
VRVERADDVFGDRSLDRGEIVELALEGTTARQDGAPYLDRVNGTRPIQTKPVSVQQP